MRDLLAWNEDERFFKVYRQACARGSKAVSELLARTGPDREYVGFAVDPARIEAQKPERGYFPEGRNVALVKHPRCLPAFRHAHEFFELGFVLVGACRQQVGDAVCDLREGDVCFIAPGTEHELYAGEDALVLNVLVRSSTFLDVFFNDLRSRDRIARFFLGSLYGVGDSSYLVISAAGDDAVLDVLLEMYRECGIDDAYTDRMLCDLLSVLLVRLMRDHAGDIRAGNGASGRDAELIEYIVTHSDEVTLESLAEHAGYSLSYCSRLVKELTGRPFTAFLAGVRAHRAESMLRTTNLPVAAIGAAVGYRSSETFIRAFRREFGMSPGAYRTKQAGTPEVK